MVSLRWMYDGVDPDIAGNGGAECAGYLTAARRVWESILVCALGAAYGWWGWRRASAARGHHHATNVKLDVVPASVEQGKKLLLMLMCLVLGCEIGFKCATKTLIYLLNPCHVVTIVQIYLLVAPPSRLVTVLFRWQMHSLNGAVLAIIFPVVNTRLLPFEAELYYVQHIMMLIIPFYLLKAGGVYSMERLGDFSWSILTTGSWLLYHFCPLQLIGLLTHVNLNNMLCPAISDPFCGPNYRIWATGHQSLVIGLLGKLYYVLTCVVLWLFGSGLGSGTATSSSSAIHSDCRNGGCVDGTRIAYTGTGTSNGNAVVMGNGNGAMNSQNNHQHYNNRRRHQGHLEENSGRCCGSNGDAPRNELFDVDNRNGIKVD